MSYYSVEEKEAERQKLWNYLISTDEITLEFLSEAMKVWDLVIESVGKIQFPDASVGPQGDVLFTLNKGVHHLEFEIVWEDSRILYETFYRHRDTGFIWGEDWETDDSIPEKALSYLRLFLIEESIELGEI